MLDTILRAFIRGLADNELRLGFDLTSLESTASPVLLAQNILDLF